jgi:hypothetical protein
MESAGRQQVPLTMRTEDVNRLDEYVKKGVAESRNELINRIVVDFLNDLDREIRQSTVPPLKYATVKHLHLLVSELRYEKKEGRG